MVEVTSQVLRDFLDQLARCYRFSGRLYLVGGSSLALAAAKVSTLDIDLQYDIPAEHREEFIQCLRHISRQFQLSIEQASPDQFIPLPSGFHDRHQFIGRYGLLDVFHFDFYSVALSKLHRGNEKDFADVIEMVEHGLISLDQLRTFFHEVLPQLDSFALSADPGGFKRNFELFEQRLTQR